MTTYSPVFGNTYSGNQTFSGIRRRIAQLFNARVAWKDRELMRVLLGAAAGSTATKQYKRVAHSTTELGGKRTIETVTLVNRATTSGDDTDLTNKILAYQSSPTTYPTDKARRP